VDNTKVTEDLLAKISYKETFWLRHSMAKCSWYRDPLMWLFCCRGYKWRNSWKRKGEHGNKI